MRGFENSFQALEESFKSSIHIGLPAWTFSFFITFNEQVPAQQAKPERCEKSCSLQLLELSILKVFEDSCLKNIWFEFG